MPKIFSYSLLTLACSVALMGCSTSRGGDALDSSKYLTEKPATNKPTQSAEQPKAPTQTEPTLPATKPADPAKTDSTPAVTAPIETAVMPFTESLFVESNQGSLVGAITTLKGNKVESQNPLNNGKEKLSELVIGDTLIVLFNPTDLLNGNGMDGFKTLSNKDISKETPITTTLTGYVGGFGEESSYNPEYFRNMRFGVANLGDETHLFVQGYQTPERGTGVVSALNGQHYPMPKGGKFLYEKGYALYGKDGKYDQLNAEVVADFSEKTVEVVLKQQTQDTLAFSATIDRNTFSGNKNGFETRGAFYGSLAAEVGGVFYQTQGENKGKNGVFGAVDKRPIR